MSTRATHQTTGRHIDVYDRDHRERLSSLDERILRDPGPDPEAALIAAQEQQLRPSTRRKLDLTSLHPADHWALDLWMSGLKQREIGAWMGVNRQRVGQRIERSIEQLRAQGGRIQR